MKTLKFSPNLVPLVLSGEKTTTWRLWDDKDLTVCDQVRFLDNETKEEFAVAELNSVKETKFKDLVEYDWAGHEKFDSDQEMYQSYSKAYSREVTPETDLKIVHFKLLNQTNP